MTEFTGRTAFVTGASSGIGRATALAFAAQGAQVVVADIDADSIRETVRQTPPAAWTAPTAAVPRDLVWALLPSP